MNSWDTYILVLELTSPLKARISRKIVLLEPGVYFYVGSARGAGGALARLIRHLSPVKRVNWHIDQLTTSTQSRIIGFYLVESRNMGDCESSIARALGEIMIPVKGFGCSDKPWDISHLFKCSNHVDVCIGCVYDVTERCECVDEVVYVSVVLGDYRGE